MAQERRDSIDYLGENFQLRFIQQLLQDQKYAQSVVDMIKPRYFKNQLIQLIIKKICDNWKEYNVIPDFIAMESLIKAQDGLKEHNIEELMATLDKSKNISSNNYLDVQETAKIFFKQQETITVAKKILEIAEKGNINEYYKCEELLKKAMELGGEKDEGVDVFHEVDDVLKPDYRHPIPTGIKGIDKKLNGGLAKEEFGLIIAPTGIGKTTLACKIANTAFNEGKSVLQIFFEDKAKDLQRKHYAAWSKIELGELSNNKEEVKEIVAECEKLGQEKGGKIKLKRFASDSTTIPKIKTFIKKEIANGFIPDLITIDYLDCIQSLTVGKEDWSGEGVIMRQVETMCNEFNVAIWAFTQGNRSSTKVDVVTANEMGGNFKKAQIAHVIMTVAKDLTQKENNTANMAIIKSRVGDDGIVFNNCIFNNKTLEIEVDEDNTGSTFMENKNQKEEFAQNRVIEVLAKKAIKKGLNNDEII